MLGAAQPDPLGAPLDGVGRLARGVGIGPDLEPPDLIGPGHEPLIGLPDLLLAGLRIARAGPLDRRVGQLQLTGIDLAGEAVDGHPVALVHRRPPSGELPALAVDPDPIGATHRRDALAPGDHRGVAVGPPSRGQHPLGADHAVVVIGGRLAADQDHRLAPLGPLLGVVGREHRLAHRRPRRGVQPRSDRGGPGPGGDDLLEQLLEPVGVQPQQGRVDIDQALGGHVVRP